MNIQESFDDTLRNSTLPDAMGDVAEVTIDSMLKDGLFKEIPVVKTVVGLAQVGANVHDRLFLKKIIAFLQNVDDIDPRERAKIIDQIDNSKKYRLKVGEKLLYILESCADYEGSENVARLFRAFLEGKITYDQYLSSSSIIARLSNFELTLFLKSYNVADMDQKAQELIHTGLVYSDVEEVSVDVERSEGLDEDIQADVMGGESIVRPTSTGDVVYEVFGIGREARREELRKEREERWAKRDAERLNREKQQSLLAK